MTSAVQRCLEYWELNRDQDRTYQLTSEAGANITKSSEVSITATGRELNYFSVGAATRDREVGPIVGTIGVFGNKLQYLTLPNMNTLHLFYMGRNMSSRVVTRAAQNSFNNKYGYERK